VIEKSECIRILEDMKVQISIWDWDEDYYRSGLDSKDERVDWTMDRINKVIEIVNEHLA
jgi:hypothetical protein